MAISQKPSLSPPAIVLVLTSFRRQRSQGTLPPCSHTPSIIEGLVEAGNPRLKPTLSSGSKGLVRHQVSPVCWMMERAKRALPAAPPNSSFTGPPPGLKSHHWRFFGLPEFLSPSDLLYYPNVSGKVRAGPLNSSLASQGERVYPNSPPPCIERFLRDNWAEHVLKPVVGTSGEEKNKTGEVGWRGRP